MTTFLDKNGLEYYHNNVKDLLDDKENKFETLPSDILFPKDVNGSFKIYKVYEDTDIKLLKETYHLSVVDYETTTIPKKSLLLYCRDEELTTNVLGNANSKLSYSIRVISIYGEDKLIKSTNVHNNGSTGVLTIEWSIEDYPSGSGNTVYVTDEEPETANDGDLYIDSDGIDALESEVVNSLEGNETTKAPSVKAVNDKISKTIETVALPSISVSTSTAEQTIATYTIKNDGVYLFAGKGDINYYGQNGRQMTLYIKKNGTTIWTHTGVINTYAYTLTASISLLNNLSKDDVITVTIKSSTAVNWSFGGGELYLTKLN